MADDDLRNLAWTLPKFYVLLLGLVVGLLGWAGSELYSYQLTVGREAKTRAGSNSAAIAEIRIAITEFKTLQKEIVRSLSSLTDSVNKDRCYGTTCNDHAEKLKDHEGRIRQLERGK